MTELDAVRAIIVLDAGHTYVSFNESLDTICSCSLKEDSLRYTIPSLRVYRCVICSHPDAAFIAEIDEYLCMEHVTDFLDWKNNNTSSLPTDYLQEKLNNGS